MRRLACLFLALAATLVSPAHARPSPRAVVVEDVIVEQVVVEEVAGEGGSNRFVSARPAAIPQGIARFGPFRVIDGRRAALVDVTDGRSPAAFAAMLAAYPSIAELQLVDCPGTLDDTANLRLGRMIRARGVATHVPSGGSVRSGAVELFLAGKRRSAEPGAEFAVHAWEDEDGRHPGDFAKDAPVNLAYLAYYREMGMSPIEARAFYDMTNAVPHHDARWLNAAQMGQWVRLDS
ncbi:alpha/beta hydrolase [Novosphingobium sp. TH158]|uniref:alpha/beta hydrolase n=1 Tax=Novosphingobium sp. TH158 TaxID=2067455 RepID=UPI000C79C3D7|nr:alpha/beta hydrolase [Novosphingobium sp. TH158]PLK24219.1 alpha/beta hydrolase [Novosphingobium sp. TH158]